MSSIVLVYSYSGNTKRIAGGFAQKEGLPLCEIAQQKPYRKAGAYFFGCFKALRLKPAAIEPLGVNLADYDTVYLFAPTWAGHPAPAAVAVLCAMPAGRQVALTMVSGGGQSNAEAQVRGLLAKRGCTLTAYNDVKATGDAQ